MVEILLVFVNAAIWLGAAADREGPSGKLQEPSPRKEEAQRVEVFAGSELWHHHMFR